MGVVREKKHKEKQDGSDKSRRQNSLHMQPVCRFQWLMEQRFKVILEGMLGDAVRDNTWQ